MYQSGLYTSGKYISWLYKSGITMQNANPKKIMNSLSGHPDPNLTKKKKVKGFNINLKIR